MFSDRVRHIDRSHALKLVVSTILAVHVAWIATHAWLVSNDRLNVWRLGGYAMYTIPPPFTQVHVATRDTGQDWAAAEDGAFGIFRFYEGNHLNIFRCAAPPASAMRGFFEDNPGAVGTDIRLSLSEQAMTRDPVTVSRRIYATIEMTWTGPDSVAWHHDACGEVEAGSFALSGAG